MKHLLHLTCLLGVGLLSGCLYDNPPSGPSCNINTWLVGQWETKDKANHSFKATVSPAILTSTPFGREIDGIVASPTRYSISLSGRGGGKEFEAWISRVDGFDILVVKSLSQSSSHGKYALYHYELMTPSTPSPGGIGATRIRLSELQLDESCRSLDSFKLRAAIRRALKDGTLLAPYDVVSDRRQGGIEIPGSVIWTKTGGVTLHGETF